MPHKAFALHINQNHGLQNFALLSLALTLASAKLTMPFPTLKATIVLIDFTRSCSADGEEASPKSSPKERTLKIEYIIMFRNKEHWHVIAAGRVYSGNAGLAFLRDAKNEHPKKR